MTKIGIISDLHTEFLNEREPLRSFVEQKFNDINYEGLDVLCIAGDIDYQTRSIQFIRKYILSKVPELQVIFVAGNHDYWNGSIENTIAKLKLETENIENIHFLHNSYVDLFGIRFIGATLWTDYNKNNGIVMNEARGCMNDFKKVRALNGNSKLFPSRIYTEHCISKEYILKTISESTLPTIVVTHHRPYIGKGAIRDLIGYAFCSDLVPDLEKLEKKPLYWFSGHDHKHDEQEILGMNFISNPLGYYTEYPTTNFNLNCNRVEV